MKPLIKSCGFTSNCLTFKITPDIRSLMPKHVHLILCSENRHPFNILSCPAPAPAALLCTALVYVPPCEFSTACNCKHQGFQQLQIPGTHVRHLYSGSASILVPKSLSWQLPNTTAPGILDLSPIVNSSKNAHIL